MKILLLVLLTTSLFALSSEQRSTAKQIYKIAKLEHREHTLLKIAMQESSLGLNVIGDFKPGTDITKASLGVFQFQIATVRHNQKLFPKQLGWLANYNDWQLAQRLIRDVKFSTMLACFNLRRLAADPRRNTYCKLVSGWNGGITNLPYYANVQKHSKLVNKLIKELR